MSGGARVEIQQDWGDSVGFDSRDFASGQAMALARVAALDMGRKIGEVDTSNDSGRHWGCVYLVGSVTVVEHTHVPTVGQFVCESCEEPCEERSCCDRCDECCTCDKWFCETCDEYQDDDVTRCENCETCEDCCECEHCSECSRSRNAEYICSTCEHCEDCCTCCSCTECGDRLGEGHYTADSGACYCEDCTPEDDDED